MTPTYYPEGGYELRIDTTVQGRDTVCQIRVLLDDDLTTRFDQLFDSMKEELREALLKERARAK